MERIEVLNEINTQIYTNLRAKNHIYRGKTFAVGSYRRIDSFYKTKRGAEGYIKRGKMVSYYDEMTFEMCTCGDGLEVFEIEENEIVDLNTDFNIWYEAFNDCAISFNSPYTIDGLKWYIDNYLTKESKVYNYVMKQLENLKNEIVIDKPEKVENKEVGNKEIVKNKDVEIILNEEKNGIELKFNTVPSIETRELLKESGYRWHRVKKVWYSKKNEKTLKVAQELHKEEEIKEPIQTLKEVIKAVNTIKTVIDKDIKESKEDNNIVVIKIEGEGSFNLEKIETNDIKKATENFNKRVKERLSLNKEYGYYKTFIDVEFKGDLFHTRIDINSKTLLSENIIETLKEHREKELSYIKENIENLTWIKDKKEYIEVKETILNLVEAILKIENEEESDQTEKIELVKENRGKTAISRTEVSKPLKTCLKKGILEGVETVLDNGCGKGKDVEFLREMGIDAKGFDPYQQKFKSDTELLNKEYDLVTSTFVINVIEDEKELEEYIKQTYSIASKKVVFSARFDKKAVKDNWIKLPNGGYLTPKKTYQKFYDKDSLKKLLEEVLKIDLNKNNSLSFGETIIINKKQKIKNIKENNRG